MPKIQFANLPRTLWQHLLERVDERGISVADLMALQEWVKTGSVAPPGNQFPKTALEKGMKPSESTDVTKELLTRPATCRINDHLEYGVKLAWG